MGKIRVVIIEADTDSVNADKLFSAIGGAISARSDISSSDTHTHHTHTHTQQARLSCPQCSKTFKGKQGLATHTRKAHKQ